MQTKILYLKQFKVYFKGAEETFVKNATDIKNCSRLKDMPNFNVL